jgi:hypothetical protein
LIINKKCTSYSTRGGFDIMVIAGHRLKKTLRFHIGYTGNCVTIRLKTKIALLDFCLVKLLNKLDL